jgi:hypothetical protein
VDIHTEIIIRIPLRNGRYKDIKQFQIDNWSKQYPNIDVITELTNLTDWYNKNPNKKKTETDLIDHISNCLRKAKQNKFKLEGLKQQRSMNVSNISDIFNKQLKAV